MKKFFSSLGIIISALLIVGIIFGGLVFLLVWMPAAGEPKERPDIECPEGGNSYLCVIKSYLQSQEPKEI